MSLENAEKFIYDCYDKNRDNMQDILKNLDSKFESNDAKFLYVSEKAKQLGYNFTPKEIKKAIKNVKNNLSGIKISQFTKVKDLNSNFEDKKIKNFLDLIK